MIFNNKMASTVKGYCKFCEGLLQGRMEWLVPFFQELINIWNYILRFTARKDGVISTILPAIEQYLKFYLWRQKDWLVTSFSELINIWNSICESLLHRRMEWLVPPFQELINIYLKFYLWRLLHWRMEWLVPFFRSWLIFKIVTVKGCCREGWSAGMEGKK